MKKSNSGKRDKRNVLAHECGWLCSMKCARRKGCEGRDREREKERGGNRDMLDKS
jgi:hypothetical protein